MPGILSDVLSFVLPILRIINALLVFALDVRLRCQTCTETWRPAHSYRLWMSTGVCQQRKLGLCFPWVQCSGILWTSFNCPRFVVCFFIEKSGNPETKSPGGGLRWTLPVWPGAELRGITEAAVEVHRVQVALCIACKSSPYQSRHQHLHATFLKSISGYPGFFSYRWIKDLSLCRCITSQVL